MFYLSISLSLTASTVMLVVECSMRFHHLPHSELSVPSTSSSLARALDSTVAIIYLISYSIWWFSSYPCLDAFKLIMKECAECLSKFNPLVPRLSSFYSLLQSFTVHNSRLCNHVFNPQSFLRVVSLMTRVDCGSCLDHLPHRNYFHLRR